MQYLLHMVNTVTWIWKSILIFEQIIQTSFVNQIKWSNEMNWILLSWTCQGDGNLNFTHSNHMVSEELEYRQVKKIKNKLLWHLWLFCVILELQSCSPHVHYIKNFDQDILFRIKVIQVWNNILSFSGEHFFNQQYFNW